MSGEIPTNPEHVKPRESEHPPVERVVIIDDEPAVGRVVERVVSMASKKQATITRYEQAGAALTSLRTLAEEHPEQLPQVIITDRDLDAGVKGEELMLQIREIPGLADVRFIGLTGNDEGRDAMQAAGMELALLKPFKNEELINHLFPKKPA
ncbi:MAG: response regulator [Candidatus Andersenbacteria bacterium]